MKNELILWGRPVQAFGLTITDSIYGYASLLLAIIVGLALFPVAPSSGAVFSVFTIYLLLFLIPRIVEIRTARLTERELIDFTRNMAECFAAGLNREQAITKSFLTLREGPLYRTLKPVIQQFQTGINICHALSKIDPINLNKNFAKLFCTLELMDDSRDKREEVCLGLARRMSDSFDRIKRFERKLKLILSLNLLAVLIITVSAGLFGGVEWLDGGGAQIDNLRTLGGIIAFTSCLLGVGAVVRQISEVWYAV